MFRRLPDRAGEVVTFTFDGETVTAMRGDSVAAALLASGSASVRRSAVSGAGRGPYCMMGVCFDCLVTIDGAANRQGCLVQVENGMRVQTQDGAADYREDAP